MSEAARNSPHHPENHARVETTLASICKDYPGVLGALETLNKEDLKVLVDKLAKLLPPAEAEPEPEPDPE